MTAQLCKHKTWQIYNNALSNQVILLPHKYWVLTGSRNTTEVSSCRKGATLVHLAHPWNRQLCNPKGHSTWVRVLSIRKGLKDKLSGDYWQQKHGTNLCCKAGSLVRIAHKQNRQPRHWNSRSASVPVPRIRPWEGKPKTATHTANSKPNWITSRCVSTKHAMSTPSQLRGQWI